MLNGAGQVVTLSDGARYSPTERGSLIKELEAYRYTPPTRELFTDNIWDARLKNNLFEIVTVPVPDPALQNMRVVYRGDQHGVKGVLLQDIEDHRVEITLRDRTFPISQVQRITEPDRRRFDELLYELEKKYLR